MILTPGTLRSWVKDLFEASGLGSDAPVAADVYVRATLRGLGHHDIASLPQRLDWLARGEVNARPRLTLVSESAATEVWDGDEGLGEVLCTHITRRALELAKKAGVGYAGVRRSNHFLAADPYTQMGAEAGYLVVIWSNTDAGMAFPGQARRQIGNNPLGWRVGTGESALSADLSMAYSSLGNLNRMVSDNESAPLHWGRGPDGHPTSDPKELLSGGVGPIGGHKGLALALLGEVLTGVLTGGATLDQISPGGGLRTHSQMVLAFDLDQFGGRQAVSDRVAGLKQRAKVVGGTVRLPGERSQAAEHQGTHEGIAVGPLLESSLREWSARLGVQAPGGL